MLLYKNIFLSSFNILFISVMTTKHIIMNEIAPKSQIGELRHQVLKGPITPSLIVNARGLREAQLLCNNVTLPAESPLSGGDVYRRRCKKATVVPNVVSSSSTNEPELKIRKIISTKQCVFSDTDFLCENQINMLQTIIENGGVGKLNHQCIFVLQEINKKIGGYKTQDKMKGLFDPTAFVDETYVLQLLLGSQLDCFYCKKKTNVLYQQVREPSQWSLERIDNSMGHNKGNVEIACLSCNLSRKTMYHERFAFTKQLGKIIKLSK